MFNLDIGKYKDELSKLAQEAIYTNGDLTRCPDEIIERYKTSTSTGKSIYESFSDDELKQILIESFERLGRCPAQSEVFYIYKTYIRLRFGNWPWALQAAGLKPTKEHAHMRKKKPYWRCKNIKNGGKSNANPK